MIGEKLSDRYELKSELGRGGMGVVYCANDLSLNREVAVKLIPPALLSPEAEQRFLTEAKVVGQMDHPSIVPIYDLGHHGDSLFYVMPVVSGRSLRHILQSDTLTLGEVLDLGIQIASALDYSHSRNILHRDIKPENIMITRSDGEGIRARLMDFGLAQDTNATRMTRSGVLMGTMAYVSPELVQGQPCDYRVDIYALGTVLYECLTSKTPFSGEIQSILYRIAHELPQSPREMGADIDESLDQILMSCLEKDPKQRPQSGSELASSLRKYRTRLRDSEINKSILTTRVITAPGPAASPFVGRKAIMAELQRRLNSAIGGECQFVTIGGEPGSGKTRVADHLEELARARSIRVLHGRLVEQDGAFPYHGFCEAIQEYFREKESASSSSEIPDFSDLAPQLTTLFPMLSEMEQFRAASSGSISVDAASVSGATGATDQTQVFELLAKVLARMAGGKPLLLILEDLHGAEGSIDALQYIIRRLGPTPTMIIGTYRTTEMVKRGPLDRMIEGFEGDRRIASIKLEAFAPDEHSQFLQTLIGGPGVGEKLTKQLYDAAEGNPFFTKELVRSLLDSGGIAPDDTGSWELSGDHDISSGDLPATIQQVIEKRVSTLPENQRRVLSIASVIGRTFEFDDLEALASDEDDLDDAVDKLVSIGIIEEDARSRGDRLTFSSGVLHDVLYADLSRRKRRGLHRKYAARLEKRNAGRLENVYPELVYHYSEGDVPEKTVSYGLELARKSLETFSQDEAVRTAKTVLDFLDDEWEGDPNVEGDVRLILSRAERMAGNLDAAIQQAERAVNKYRENQEKEKLIDALLVAAQCNWQARRTENAEAHIEQGIEEARAHEKKDALRELLILAGTIANLRGNHESANLMQEEIEKLDSTGRRDTIAEEIPKGGHLVVGMSSTVKATDPALMAFDQEAEILANSYQTLLHADDQGTLQPLLCEKWEVFEGGKKIVFSLRRDVHFHDGHHMKAEDIKRAFEEAIRFRRDDPAAAFTAIKGMQALYDGEADSLEGIQLESDYVLSIELKEALPIYPVLLTASATAIVRRVPKENGDGTDLYGTGPFLFRAHDGEKVRLERNDKYWQQDSSNVNQLTFMLGMSAKDRKSQLETGAIDIARDLTEGDLEAIQRDPRFRGRIVEALGRNTFFAFFNCISGPVARHKALREALARVVNTRDLVWRAIGRYGQPAMGLIPPGLLGHDAGRRRTTMSMDDARDQIASLNLPSPIELKVSISPMAQDTHKQLIHGLFATWRELGVEPTIVTPTETAAEAAEVTAGSVDVLLGGWVVDFVDPDDIAYGLLNSKSGHYRRFYSSEILDELLTKARTESRLEIRESTYRQFESFLEDETIILPLHHDIKYRISGPKVRGLRLGTNYPYVNYESVGKAERDATPAAHVSAVSRGTIRLGIVGDGRRLDPARVIFVDDGELCSGIFDTLMRATQDAGITPSLAEKARMMDGGKRFAFRLRDNVEFHDGRRLTARDVRSTFERLMRDKESDNQWVLSMIVGARDFILGESDDLKGFRILSTREFEIDLEEPCPFFLALLTNAATSIVPEGIEFESARTWREGLVGTGAFRVIRYDPAVALELERNPGYWRKGFPKSEKLVFEFNTPVDELESRFREGRSSLGYSFPHQSLIALRRDAELGRGYREAPSIGVNFVAFNNKTGVFSSVELRRKVARAIHESIRKTADESIVVAKGIFGPGLLGHAPSSMQNWSSLVPRSEEPIDPDGDRRTLRVLSNPGFRKNHPQLFDLGSEVLTELGFDLEIIGNTNEEYERAHDTGETDMLVGGWYADFPDAHSIIQGLLDSRVGICRTLCTAPGLQDLIDRAQFETDTATRELLYRQIEELIAREALMVPLYHEQMYRIGRPELEGLTVSFTSPFVDYANLRIRR